MSEPEVSIDSKTEEKIHQTAEMLAKRYKDRQEYEDLFQEGYLAAWESLCLGQDYPTAIGHMRRAMNDYKNITLKPVTVPKSGAVYALLSSIKSSKGVTPQGHTELALYEALIGSVEGIQPATMGLASSTEDDLSEKDLHDYINNQLWRYLTVKEGTTLHLMFFEEYTQKEVAKELGVSQQTVSLSLWAGLDKLNRSLQQVS